MGTLSFFPPSLSSQLRSHENQLSLKTQLSNPLKFPKISVIKPFLSKKSCNRSVVVHSNQNDSQFVDENGVIEDMDGYMNHLSLEYDSVWDTKPAWCQPWTITLTGVSAIGGSWIILHSVIISAVVVFLISAWWYIFLYSYPKEYSSMILERRNKVNSGLEDTFGNYKSQ
ncbi:hypothetical protein C5167_017303 [Papaver somniferum]|uniref:DUF6737 domain-containing protein n=1 Tax=Papaver somniferum TaxID=3469 RepID=A0A4Y7IN44_PAPSO|nr:uncharacterized protein LOC113347116 [Papaver somniferum]RZC48875.1 hypothetical protein C5167_017303 [Papaver somniferum]